MIAHIDRDLKKGKVDYDMGSKKGKKPMDEFQGELNDCYLVFKVETDRPLALDDQLAEAEKELARLNAEYFLSRSKLHSLGYRLGPDKVASKKKRG